MPLSHPIINVTKTYLPKKEDYLKYLELIWETNTVTNNGPLVQELEAELCNKLRLKHLQYVANGTIALQIAIKALNLTGEIITTPFSYVATTNCIFWENLKPKFVDINPVTLCIDSRKIEEAITAETSAILATHVFGIPCDVEKIEKIAKKHNLKVIYDAAHAFGVKKNGISLLKYGDISTVSFHATKVFHTIEGGAVVTSDSELNNQVFSSKAFGHIGSNYINIGINGKNSELHAAIGLCNLRVIDLIIAKRKEITQTYQSLLNNECLKLIKPGPEVLYNYAYFPVLISTEEKLKSLMIILSDNQIFPRRYFYPSLNKLPFFKTNKICPISEDISKRILCLPLYHDLSILDVKRICQIINKKLN